MNERRIIIGLSGATGIVYGVRALQLLRECRVETHLVMTKPAEQTRAYESEYSSVELRALADKVYPIDDVGSAIASGSFKTMGMIVAPCSIRTLSEIATGVTSNLLTRAADVVLKERRRLVLMVRETPLHAGHLKSMLSVTEAGGIIAPPVPAFYTNPKTLDDVIDQTVCRTLDLFDIDHPRAQRWGESKQVPIKPFAKESV